MLLPSPSPNMTSIMMGMTKAEIMRGRSRK